MSIKKIKDIFQTSKKFDDNDEIPDTVHSNIREDIIQASIDLFRKKGYNNTSITDIIKRAGLGRGTFYSNFKHKEYLFLECADKIFLDIDIDSQEIHQEKDILQKLKMRGKFFFLHFKSIFNMLNQMRFASVGNNKIFKKNTGKSLKTLLIRLLRILTRELPAEFSEISIQE